MSLSNWVIAYMIALCMSKQICLSPYLWFRNVCKCWAMVWWPLHSESLWLLCFCLLSTLSAIDSFSCFRVRRFWFVICLHDFSCPIICLEVRRLEKGFFVEFSNFVVESFALNCAVLKFSSSEALPDRICFRFVKEDFFGTTNLADWFSNQHQSQVFTPSRYLLLVSRTKSAALFIHYLLWVDVPLITKDILSENEWSN